MPLEGLLWWHLSLHKATFVGLGPQGRGTLFPCKKERIPHSSGSSACRLNSISRGMSAPGFAPQCSPGITELPRAGRGQQLPSLSLPWHISSQPTCNWGNPSFSILQVFPSKLVTKPASNMHNNCLIKLGSPPPWDRDSDRIQPQLDLGGGGSCCLQPLLFSSPILQRWLRPQVLLAQSWSIRIAHRSPGIREAGGRKPAISTEHLNRL